MFVNNNMGTLVPITGTTPTGCPWEHHAYVPAPLSRRSPELTASTYRRVANARAALASLDSTAARLSNPTLLRQPTLRQEAQSTSALEGTYEPLDQVLLASIDDPGTITMREVVNFVLMADDAFAWQSEGRPVTVGLLEDLHARLMQGTASDGPDSGMLRTTQVVIGRRADAAPNDLPVHAASFVPGPPGADLRARVAGLVDWMRLDLTPEVDPLVVAAMAHYQFETLHPFHDGNGRIGRLLIVMHLKQLGLLDEPTLLVSPWFEQRRQEYYSHLFTVSSTGDWDGWVQFFAEGIRHSAEATRARTLALLDVQESLRSVVASSTLRGATAPALVDFAVGNPSFTVRRVEAELGVSYGRANALVDDLVGLGVLLQINGTHPRRFFAPAVLQVLTAG